MQHRRRFIIERAILPPKSPRRLALPEPERALKVARRRDRFAKAIAALEFQRKRS